MKKILLTLLGLVMVTSLWADEVDNTLVVKLKNGAETTFVLKDKPNVTFEGTDLKVVTEKETVAFALSDVLRFTYIKKNPSGIDEKVVDPTEVGYKDGVLVISQFAASAHCSSFRDLSPESL